MTVKHTHPDYTTPEKRQEALQDVQKACAVMLQAMRANSVQQTA